MHSDDFGIGIIVSPGRVPGISENRQGVCHGGAPNLPRLTINYLYAIVAITHPSALFVICRLARTGHYPRCYFVRLAAGAPGFLRRRSDLR
jgi:hypothetical protein